MKIEKFQEIVQKAIDQGLVKDLCEEFELGPHTPQGFGYGTVSRWANGTAQPLPRFKNLIIQFLEKRIK